MKILVAYDGSEGAESAVADLRRAGIPAVAEILVVSVVDAGSHDASQQDTNEARALVGIASKWIQENFPGWKVSGQVLTGSPADVILNKARSWKPDLLVAGSHGRSLAGRVLLGSVSSKLLHEAPCSVRIVRPGTSVHAAHAGHVGNDGRPVHILIGCDASPNSEYVLQQVAGRSWYDKAEVRIVMAVDTIMPMAYALEASIYTTEPALSMIQDSTAQQRARFQELVDKTRANLQRAGLTVTSAIVEGDPKRALVVEAERWGADTIFIGAHGRSHLEEFLLGSVSTAVLNHAHCAVEIVRNAVADGVL